MEQQESDEELVECVDCGAPIADGADPSFAFGTRSTLCFECAIRRGGEYDAEAERWTVTPDVSSLEGDGEADV